DLAQLGLPAGRLRQCGFDARAVALDIEQPWKRDRRRDGEDEEHPGDDPRPAPGLPFHGGSGPGMSPYSPACLSLGAEKERVSSFQSAVRRSSRPFGSTRRRMTRTSSNAWSGPNLFG